MPNELAGHPPSVRRIAAAVGLVVVLWAAVLALLAGHDYGGDIRGFVVVSAAYRNVVSFDSIPRLGRSGYDGQHYAALATDPLLRDPTLRSAVDSPAYRARRILVPFVAWTLGFGDAIRAQSVYVLLCWFGGLAVAAVVALWASTSGRSVLWVLVAAPSLGVAVSMVRATPDAFALALLAASLFAYRQQHRPLSLLLLVAAVFARETSLLGALALALTELRSSRVRGAAAFALVPGALFIVWTRMPAVMFGRGGLMRTTLVGAPFAWLPTKVAEIKATGISVGGHEFWALCGVMVAVAAGIGLLVQPRRVDAVDTGYLLFALLATSLTMRVYVEDYAYSRVLIALPTLALIASFRDQPRWRRAMLLAVTVPSALAGILMVAGPVSRALSDGERPWPQRHTIEAGAGTLSYAGDWRRAPEGLALTGEGTLALAPRQSPRLLRISPQDRPVELLRGSQSLMTIRPGSAVDLPLWAGPAGSLRARVASPTQATLIALVLVTAPPAPAASARVLPVVTAPGDGGGVKWNSMLVVENRSDDPIACQVALIGPGFDRTRAATASLSLAGKERLLIRDPAKGLFGFAGWAALVVEPESAAASVKTRVAATTSYARVGREATPGGPAFTLANRTVSLTPSCSWGATTSVTLFLFNAGTARSLVEVALVGDGNREVARAKVNVDPSGLATVDAPDLGYPCNSRPPASLRLRSVNPKSPMSGFAIEIASDGHDWRFVEPQ